jgi:hypothetical protein
MWMKQEKDNREDYPYGYSPRGERCHALKCGRKRERVSWISALKTGKILAPLTFEGCCNRELFENWLAKSLLPKLEPGTLIILDNATFHKGETIREIVEAAGCELWYLLLLLTRFKQNRKLVVCFKELDETKA